MSSEQNLLGISTEKKRRSKLSRSYFGELETQTKSDSAIRESVRLKSSYTGQSNNLDLTEMAHEQKFLFLCGRCDMLVREEDEKCQFCGAEFATEDEETENEIPEIPILDPQVEKLIESETELSNIDTVDISVSESVNQKLSKITPRQHVSLVDVVGMVAYTNANLNFEHLSGGASHSFSQSAGLIRRVEKVIEEANDFGAETGKAKKYLAFARKAFNEGRWSRAISFAEKARRVLTPNVTNIVRGQISCLREAMIEMKHHGKTLAPMIIEMKTIQRALNESRLDDAIEMTRTLITATRKAQMELIGEGKDESLSLETKKRPPIYGDGI